MTENNYFLALRNKLPLIDNDPFLTAFKEKCRIIEVEKNEILIRYQTDNKKMFFIASGSFTRSIISSRGEEKTIMFHTDSFHEFMKAYDTIYFHQKTNYEVRANEKAVVIVFDYEFLYKEVMINHPLQSYFLQKTEELLTTLDVFRNFQLGLTSEEYLIWLYDNYGFIFLQFPAKNIASFMGITPVWLSKLKTKLLS